MKFSSVLGFLWLGLAVGGCQMPEKKSDDAEGATPAKTPSSEEDTIGSEATDNKAGAEAEAGNDANATEQAPSPASDQLVIEGDSAPVPDTTLPDPCRAPDEKSVEPSPQLSPAVILFSQLVEKQAKKKSVSKGLEVSLYAVFKTPYEGSLSLRAIDGNGHEAGRSLESVSVKQKEDSATYLTFRFDARMPFDRVASYHVVGPTPKTDDEEDEEDEKVVSKTKPRPKPPQRIVPSTGMTPKNP